ncbi:RidA family protein [Nocardia paucivorans]|uniref:RidA family protein n=1 Tax=Nocardia paucivorans TaxID=114259 RepID=UPI0005948D1F|nr:Rid family hydrolase [Nocardia paucivorans]
MAIDFINPPELHDPLPFGYSHIARTRGELVFIAGQYDSDSQGNPTSDDFVEQVDHAFANLGIALTAAGAGFGDVAQLRTYVVDHDPGKLAILGKKVTEIWGDRPPAQTLLGVATLALPDMLFEVDAVAIRPS